VGVAADGPSTGVSAPLAVGVEGVVLCYVFKGIDRSSTVTKMTHFALLIIFHGFHYLIDLAIIIVFGYLAGTDNIDEYRQRYR
jgi:hypothetical protein